MHITEIAPADKRGRLVSINQLGIAAIVFVKSAVPETKGKTLEEIDRMWIAD